MEKICVRSKPELLEVASKWNRYLVLMSVALSLNWGLSGLFMVAPAYISPSESKQTIQGFVKVQDEFNISDSAFHKIEYVASVFSLGNLIVGPITSRLSDRFGRRPLIVYCIFCTGILGVLCAFSTSFEMLLTFRFLQGSLYSATTLVTWVHVSECTRKTTHSVWGVVFGLSWIFGSSLLSLVVIISTDWREVLLWLSLPNILLSTVLFWYLPESIEYSIHAKDHRAVQYFVEKIVQVDPRLQNVEISYKEIVEFNQSGTEQRTPSVLNLGRLLLTDCKLTCFLGIACYMFFTSTLLHNALALTSTVIEVGNVHWNFVLSSIVEIPSYVIVPFLLYRIGRRLTLFSFHAISAISAAGVVLVTTDRYIPYLCCWLLVKFACSSAYMCFLIFASVLFPVEYRNFCIGICSTVGNIGAVLAPQSTILNTIRPGFMFTVFGMAAALAAGLTIFIPKKKENNHPQKNHMVQDLTQRY